MGSIGPCVSAPPVLTRTATARSSARSAPGALVSAAPPETRRTVTALFCDLVGSTSLGERHDPELLRPILERYFAEMRSAVERHGGRVQKFIGDAVVAIFGVPLAHEDDGLRAVRAAVEMHERLETLNETLPIRLAARIGITTGEVVLSGDDAPVVGDAMNTASRLQSAAEPGGVLIGEPTWRLVRSAIVAEAVEPLDAKGKAEPVPAWRVVAIDPVATRSATPFVGRERPHAATRGGAGGRDRRPGERARHDPGAARGGKVEAGRGVRGRGRETGDGARRTDSRLRRGRDVRAARRTARTGGRQTVGGRRGGRGSAARADGRAAGRPIRRRPARAVPRSRRGGRRRHLVGGAAPARGARRGATAGRHARRPALRGAADARPGRRGHRARPRPRPLPLPGAARARRAAPDLGGRQAACDHDDPPAALAARRARGRAAVARRERPRVRRRPHLRRRPRGIRSTWNSSRRCSPIRGCSSTAAGWARTMPRWTSRGRCRRSSPPGSTASTPARA